MSNILDPGYELTLRPMHYPQFFEMFKNGIKNTWTVEEINFQIDISDLASKMTPAERHLIHRLVAFFATGDTIVSNNLVLNLYQHINAPEARMYLSRQLFEEALHIQTYLTILDNYIPDHDERHAAFAAIENIPSIKQKGDFCFKWIDSIQNLHRLETKEQRRQFLLNLICFAACIEGLFFFGAFAYVYFLRSKGLLPGLASATNYVFKDEACLPLDTTDILTEKGFVSLRKVVEEGGEYHGIKVGQYTAKGFVEFVEPRAYVNKHYKGKLVKVGKDKSISLTTTPDHDNVSRSSTTGLLRKTKAADISTSTTAEMVCAGGGVGDWFYLTDAERFFIVYQADGHTVSDRYDGSRSGIIPVTFSFAKERKIQRFAKLLNRLNWDYRVDTAPAVGNRSEQKVFTVRVPTKFQYGLEKDFSWVDISRVNVAWGRGFIEELSHWDSYRGPHMDPCIQYTNTNKAAVDTVQAIATLSWYACNQYAREDDRSDTFSTVYNLYIRNRDHCQLSKAEVKEVDFDGDVGCVNVPSGMIIVRQNGKVHVTGNCHMEFAFAVVDVVRQEEPDLFDEDLKAKVYEMLDEAVECEYQFSQDVLSGGVSGMTPESMRQYLQYCADQRFARFGMERRYHVKNPFDFMELQDVQELTNFFERRVTAYQVGVEGEVAFDQDF